MATEINKKSSGLYKNLQSLSLKKIKLHLGCGGMKWKDYINIDLYPYDNNVSDTSRSGCVADIFADISKMDLPDDYIDEIFCSHTIEHFTRWAAIDILSDWHRMLKKGGRLIVEMPDFWRCVFWLFHYKSKKRKLARSQFYGNQWDHLDYETHRYLWSAKEFKKFLSELGFSYIKINHKPKTHYRWRDMRVIAIK